MNLKRLLVLSVSIVAILVCGDAYPCGPFVVDEINYTGTADRWTNDTLEWYADSGALSTTVNNTSAVDMVIDLLETWTSVTIDNASSVAVSTTTAKASYKGTVGTDIDETNYTPFIFSNDETRTVVIFDDDGKITTALGMDPASVVGLSQPLIGDSTGLYITKGFALLNGKVLSAGTVTTNQFKAAILHELGHLLNLDHTQVNYDTASLCTLGGSCDGGSYIPTMYPELLSESQQYPKRDDKIGISWIYPSSAFSSDFCTISGEIFDANGNPLKGVNVIAMRVNEGDVTSKVDSRSFVTGVMRKATESWPLSSATTADCVGDARYYLYGIVPGREYQVIYEPIASEFTGASSIEPLDPPPSGFTGGYICPTSASGSNCSSYTVKCDSGGQTIDMASVTINTTNRCTYKASSTTTTTSSKCNLMPIGVFDATSVVCLALALAAILLRRRVSF